MGKKRSGGPFGRFLNRSAFSTWLCSDDAYGDLCVKGYVPLSANPEILTGVTRIANLMASMTLHLMSNTDKGDVRINNELSRFLDITPNRWMTRFTWMAGIVRCLLLEGDGNAVVYPRTSSGLLQSLDPIAPGRVAFQAESGGGYSVRINGVAYNPDDLLHFVVNPDPDHPWQGTGYRVALRDVAKNLKQESETKRGFLGSKWKPSLVVKVDGLTEEFSDKAGRKRLLDDYLDTAEAGEPWMIPADQFEVQQIKPLSLTDLALNESVSLDKQTVASILGVPPFVLGVGAFNKDAWNNFIDTSIMPLATMIQQEMTRKLLLSPNWYVRFNSRSLHAYDIKDLASIGDDQFVRGIMTGNEVRDWLGQSPMDGLDELVILENYIPRGMIGDQKKLNGGET